jgi:hypothetical protein
MCGLVFQTKSNISFWLIKPKDVNNSDFVVLSPDLSEVVRLCGLMVDRGSTGLKLFRFGLSVRLYWWR